MDQKTLYSYYMKFIQSIRTRGVTILKTHRAQKIMKWSGRVFVASILGYMIYRFFQIGWFNLLNSLPAQPFFYILYFPLFFALPFTEMFIYKIMWPVTYKKLLPVLLVKKVYNNEVLGYSGEVFLFQWGSKKLGKSNIDVMKNIKDNNVISLIASLLFTLLIMIVFFETNPTLFNKWIQEISGSRMYLAIVSVVVILAVALKFKRYIISLPFIPSFEIFAIHFARHILVVVIQIYQWHIVLPEISLHVWYTFMIARIALAMMPFIPNKDLLFITISMSLSTMLEAPLAAVTAIIVVNSALDRTLHVSIYSYYQFLMQKKSLFADLHPADAGPVRLQPKINLGITRQGSR